MNSPTSSVMTFDRVGAVEARLGETLPLPDLAAVAGISPCHFARGSKAAPPLPPHRYVLPPRIELAKRLSMTSGVAVPASRSQPLPGSSSPRWSACCRACGRLALALDPRRSPAVNGGAA